VPIEFTMRQVGVDVLYGLAPRAAPLPQPVAIPSIPLAPYFPPQPQLSYAPPASCPAAGEFAVPKLVADPIILAPAAPGTYAYRDSGKWSLGETPGTYGPVGRRSVAAGSASTGFDFAVVEQAAPSQYLTAFQLVQPGTAPPGGLYIAAMAWQDPVLGDLTFQPVRGLQFFPLPAQTGGSWESSATDALHQTSVDLVGSIPGKTRVDACGRLIDAWTADVTMVVVTPTQQLDISATYEIATQYGGLAVADEVTVSGLEGGKTITYELKGTISQLPNPTVAGGGG
jgi:hypothetical protein